MFCKKLKYTKVGMHLHVEVLLLNWHNLIKLHAQCLGTMSTFFCTTGTTGWASAPSSFFLSDNIYGFRVFCMRSCLSDDVKGECITGVEEEVGTGSAGVDGDAYSADWYSLLVSVVPHAVSGEEDGRGWGWQEAARGSGQTLSKFIDCAGAFWVDIGDAGGRFGMEAEGESELKDLGTGDVV